MLTPEVILEINKKVIGIVKNVGSGDIYVCILCLAQINSITVMYMYNVLLRLQPNKEPEIFANFTTRYYWRKPLSPIFSPTMYVNS